MAILALVYLWLATRVIGARRRTKIALGGGESGLERAVRAHGNFAEYVPMALLLLLSAELAGASPWLLHGMGLVLTVARVVHARGISRTPEDFRWRVAGMSGTLGVIGTAALVNLWLWLR